MLKPIKQASEAFQHAVISLERKFFQRGFGKLKAEFVALEHRVMVAEGRGIMQ